MKPGRLEEQPMPLTTSTWCGFSPSSNSAVCRAERTVKSPQPGHQSGWIFPLNVSLLSWPGWTVGWAGGGAVSTAELIVFSDVYFVEGNGNFLPAGELLLHRLDNMVGHEGFAVVFADVAVRDDAGLGAKITRKLPGE